MQVRLIHGDIGKVKAEGLVCPVDGHICILGGPAAATVLKKSFDPEERNELFGYLEDDIKRLCPIPHGEARIIEGDGDWEWLVIIAALPHHVNDTILTENDFASILEKAIVNGIRVSIKKEIKSIAMTVIGSSYRLPVASCILSAVDGIKQCHRENIEIIWCFLEGEQLKLAEKLLSQAGINFSSMTVDG